MKKITVLCLSFFVFCSCDEIIGKSDFEAINWSAREATIKSPNALESGKSYLSVYSQIYSYSQHKMYDLTAMISIRNASIKDSIYLHKVDFYGTHGALLKSYVEKPVYVRPMETLDIVINEVDKAGGTGGNFIFHWSIPENCPEPIFEGVMTSTSGQQGLSFLTEAKRIE